MEVGVIGHLWMTLGHTCTVIVKVFTRLEEEGRGGGGRGKRSRREKRKQEGEQGAGRRRGSRREREKGRKVRNGSVMLS